MTPAEQRIGTIEWCRRTRGLLTAAERRRFIAAVMLQTVRSMPRLLLLRAGRWGRGPDPSVFTPPDTALTRRVLDACAHLDPMLVQHSVRSYLFARALGARDGLACDDEALFVAAMLHDYAFPTSDTTDDQCFSHSGAEAAAQVLRESSLSPQLFHDVLDAITLHVNPRVTSEEGVLQHLLHGGILIDTVGVRAWDLDKLGVGRVVARHPRHGFVLRGEPGLRAHAKRVAGSRAEQLYRCGLPAAIRIGPWRAHELRAQLAAPPAALLPG